jgi:hypothetical protein
LGLFGALNGHKLILHDGIAESQAIHDCVISRAARG